MPRIKIVRIITRLNIGGPAIHVMELADMFNNGDYSTTLIYGNVEGNEQDMLYLAQNYDLELVNIPAMGRSVSPLADLSVVWQLWRVIRKIKPDIVHTHTAKAGQLGRLAAWLARVPVILHTFHGNNFSGYFSPLLSWFSVVLERLMARVSQGIISISGQQKAELLKYRIAPETKIRVIPRGVDLARITHSESVRGEFKKEFGIPARYRLAAFVGRLTAIKDPFLFLEIASAILAIHKDVIFVFAGDGEQKEDLKARVRELGQQENIIFSGFIQDLRPLYADLDILLLTSRNEGTPVAVIEAMANGVPVIASRVGGIPDLIEDGVSGTLLNAGDIAGFCAAVSAALNEPEKCLRMADAALARVQSEYSLERLQASMTELIHALLPEPEDR
ncbi:MAG: glycosyltransferase family 4 protein [Candidatus Syntrophosphaera sp.]|nr:glycosyltransferase family 4 protein [Candidatus Syntrophosphaera sp.]